ncbi:phosphotransferase [Lujinxingia vulgaris]|uniref:Phosphotransferase n=1 Tax=Lujinxingia vulgaris TaxID=2600176 RepID=A0A5C6XFI1_9DELT|nr:phosphotransferase [Lujinxingia vulgaris]TXD38153.1 phosphotransferase [Lujinxingia vulgaris]
MTSDSKTTGSLATTRRPPLPETTRRLADEPGWTWDEVEIDGERRWHFRWPDAARAGRHQALCDEIAAGALTLSTEAPSRFSAARWAPARAGLPLSSITDLSSRLTMMRALGQALRRLHNHPCPDGFGVPTRLHLAGTAYFQTFNAAIAARLDEMARRLENINDDAEHVRLTETFAWLRQSLSSFHPRTRSVWTVTNLTPGRILAEPEHGQLTAFLDLSQAALRPPESDLAIALSPDMAGVSPATERAFWAGYGAAPTMDLRRRLRFFTQLAQLDAALPAPR